MQAATPAQKPAAAHGHDDGVHRRQLAEYFQRDGALPGHDLIVVEGVQEGRALALANLHGPAEGLVIAVAVEDDPRAVALGGLHLGDGRGLGHDYGRGQAVAVRGEGHALGVIARAGGDDGLDLAALDQRAYLVGRAAYLERTGLLPVLALEPDLSAGHVRKRRAAAELRLVDYPLEPALGHFKIPECQLHFSNLLRPRGADFFLSKYYTIPPPASTLITKTARKNTFVRV